MQRPTRTLAVGLAAAAVAIGGGAVVADAANHASFATSGSQGGPGAGRLGSPPPGFAGAPAMRPGGGGAPFRP